MDEFVWGHSSDLTIYDFFNPLHLGHLQPLFVRQQFRRCRHTRLSPSVRPPRSTILDMDRRKVLQIGVLAAALPAATPAQEKPHPEPVSQPPDKPDWKPQVFDDHQSQTVIVLTDRIIPATDTPGAKAANASRYIDLYLADGPDSERTRFLDGLSWLDGHAIATYAHPFIGCTSD